MYLAVAPYFKQRTWNKNERNKFTCSVLIDGKGVSLLLCQSWLPDMNVVRKGTKMVIRVETKDEKMVCCDISITCV